MYHYHFLNTFSLFEILGRNFFDLFYGYTFLSVFIVCGDLFCFSFSYNLYGIWLFYFNVGHFYVELDFFNLYHKIEFRKDFLIFPRSFPPSQFGLDFLLLFLLLVLYQQFLLIVGLVLEDRPGGSVLKVHGAYIDLASSDPSYCGAFVLPRCQNLSQFQLLLFSKLVFCGFRWTPNRYFGVVLFLGTLIGPLLLCFLFPAKQCRSCGCRWIVCAYLCCGIEGTPWHTVLLVSIVDGVLVLVSRCLVCFYVGIWRVKICAAAATTIFPEPSPLVLMSPVSPHNEIA